MTTKPREYSNIGRKLSKIKIARPLPRLITAKVTGGFFFDFPF